MSPFVGRHPNVFLVCAYLLVVALVMGMTTWAVVVWTDNLWPLGVH